MTEAQVNKFMSAVEAAEIDNFCFVDDITCYYTNSESGVCVYDSADKAIISIQKNSSSSPALSNPLKFQMCDIVDIHRAEVSGTYEILGKFIEEYGLDLTDDQLKVLMRIDRNNTISKPVTGDYTTTYKKLTPEEYDALTEEEKKEYDKKKAQDQSRLVDIPKGRAGIVIDNGFPNLNRSEYL